MKHLILWGFCLILILALAGTISCDCMDDDDDDDDDSGSGGVTAEDCAEACDTAFGCGGSLWWDNEDDCIDSCNEWRDISYGCADCFIDCGTSDDSCIQVALCISECGLTDCAEVLEDMVY